MNPKSIKKSTIGNNAISSLPNVSPTGEKIIFIENNSAGSTTRVPTTPSVTTNCQPIQIRNISSDESEPMIQESPALRYVPHQNDEETSFNKGVRRYGSTSIKLLVEFIRTYINRKFVQDYNENMDIWTILDINAKLQALIFSNEALANPYTNFLHARLYPILSALFSLNDLKNQNEHITFVSCVSYTQITCQFIKFKPKNTIKEQLNNPNNNKLIEKPEKLTSLLKESINNLNKVNNSFYTIFKALTENISMLKKAQTFLPYIGHEVKKENIEVQVSNALRAPNIIAEFAAKSQFVTNVLIDAQEYPQTVLTLNIMSEFCHEWAAFLIKYANLNQKELSNPRAPFIKDCNQVGKLLKETEWKLIKLIEASSSNEWLSTTLIQTKSRKPSQPQPLSKKQQRKAAAKLITTAQSTELKIETIQAAIPQILPADILVLDPKAKVQNTAIDNESVQVPSVVSQITQNENVNQIPQIPNLVSEKVDTKLEVEDLGKADNNELYEHMFLVIFPGDRKEKLRLKEEKERAKIESARAEKQKLAEQMFEAPTMVDTEVIRIQPVTELSPKQKKTLEKIYNPQTKRGEVTFSEVQSLIEGDKKGSRCLNGRVEGNGGSRYQVYFASKLCGGFETMHGGDLNECLRENQIVNLRKAINRGVEIGHISLELIPRF